MLTSVLASMFAGLLLDFLAGLFHGIDRCLHHLLHSSRVVLIVAGTMDCLISLAGLLAVAMCFPVSCYPGLQAGRAAEFD